MSTVTFYSWDGNLLTVNADGPVSCLRKYDSRHHRPFALQTALSGQVIQLLGKCYGGRAHELSTEPVDCPDCLAMLPTEVTA